MIFFRGSSGLGIFRFMMILLFSAMNLHPVDPPVAPPVVKSPAPYLLILVFVALFTAFRRVRRGQARASGTDPDLTHGLVLEEMPIRETEIIIPPDLRPPVLRRLRREPHSDSDSLWNLWSSGEPIDYGSGTGADALPGFDWFNANWSAHPPATLNMNPRVSVETLVASRRLGEYR